MTYNNTYKKCAHCGQYINTELSRHYQAIECGQVIYLHVNPCLRFYEPSCELESLTIINPLSRRS